MVKERKVSIDEDFDILEENWNIYRLKDGTTLKFRAVLIRVFIEEIDEHGNPTFGFGLQTVFGVKPPQELRGEPSKKKYSTEELRDSITAEDIKFKPIREEWDKYRLKNGISIELKPVVTTVSRTDKFDERGDPLYVIQSHIIPKGKIPEKVKAKLQEEARGK